LPGECIPAPAVGEKNRLLSLGPFDPAVPVRTSFSRDIVEPIGAAELYNPDFLLSPLLSYDESPTAL